MPIRNLWSLEPAECIVAEELQQRGFEVYFPIRDVGVDLLVTKGEEHIKIQVKESRYYPRHRWKSGHVGHSWHQVKERKLRESEADFFIFLTYLPIHGEHKVSKFQNVFLIVPKHELEKRSEVKDSGKSKLFSFCFHFEKTQEVYDERITVPITNELADYSQFLGAWNLLQ
jgi:hypothetical protein